MAVDAHKKEELELYVENTSELYEHKKKIIAIMITRLEGNRYQRSGVVLLWKAWLRRGAAMYQREITRETFSPALITALAGELADQYKGAIERHEYTRANMGLTH